MIDITEEIVKEAKQVFNRSDRIHEYNSYIQDAIILLSRCRINENAITYHGLQQIIFHINSARECLDNTPLLLEDILIQYIEDLENK